MNASKAVKVGRDKINFLLIQNGAAVKLMRLSKFAFYKRYFI